METSIAISMKISLKKLNINLKKKPNSNFKTRLFWNLVFKKKLEFYIRKANRLLLLRLRLLQVQMLQQQALVAFVVQ